MANTYQPFGNPTNSDYGKPRGAGKTHWGQDFTAANGTQIPSATAGTVIFSGYNPSGGLGWCVVVKDANGVGHLYAHMGVAQENNNAKSPPDGMPAVGESIRVGDSLGPVGNTGYVIPPPTERQPYLGTHLHIATVEADATRVIEAQGKAIGTGGSGSLGVRLDAATTLNPGEYLQKNANLFDPAPVTLPVRPETTSSKSHSEDTAQTDPMGSDDGKSIMDAASPSAIQRADENYSHEGRTSPAARSADAKLTTIPLAKPIPGPAGDSVDGELPDGTRVVSTSTTVNGQTTVTAQLLDKAGQLLLSAGAGQTMERDPDTGIVQVRTGTSDHVQQFDPATGEVSEALRTGSDAAHVYQNLLEAFGNPQVSTSEGEQLVDASGGLPEVSKQAMGDALSDHLETQGVSKLSQAQASAMFNSLMAVNNWDHLGDVGKLSALVNLYNATDKLTEVFGAKGDNLPGDLGAAAGYLQLLQGLQSGDDLIIANSINVLSDHALDNAMNAAFGSTAAGEAVPYLSYALAIRNFADNPERAVFTAAGTYFGEALGYALGGPIGAVIGGALGGMVGGMLGGMFGGDDIPMREGLAHAQWDESGHITIVTTQDAEGGGATAHSWMSSLVSGLQAHLDQAVDANALPQYGLVPGLLPSVGFKYDPDGFNLANGAKGFMYLEWKDEAGQSQTRYYDGAGNRGDGSGETLAGDFMAHAQGAIAPAWQVQTALAHYQQSGQIDLPAQNQSLPTELTDGLHQTLQVVTLELGSGLPTEAAHNGNWIDVDADGYAEQTQWVKANQAMLAVDLDGNGQIGLGETLKLQDAGQVQHARTSMGWLDADGDGKLTAQDPAFAALKLWVDVNSDGKSANGELQTLAQANITAIDFNTNPPSIERSDGSKKDLTVQTLTADTLGVAFDRTEGGLVVTNEQLDGTGSSVLHALNSREFDGQAAHTQAGSQNLDGSQGEVVQVDANRLATTTHNTIVSSSTQTSTTVGLGDTRLKSLSASTAANPVVNSNGSPANATASTRIAFVPTTQTSAQSEIRTVTDNMIENSQSLLFGGGSASLGVLAAVGAGATASAASANEMAQRPTVVSEVRNSNANGASLVATTPVSNNTFSTTASGGVDTSTPAVTFKQVDLGVLYLPPFASNSTPITATQNTAVTTLAPTPSDPTATTFVKATVIANAPVLVSVVNSKASATGSTTTNPASEAAPDKTTQAMSAGFAPSLGYPVVQAETLSGTEDVVLRLTQSELLANDSTPNASADPTQPALTITEVSAPLNGQVSLVNGEVLFAPDANFHGTASFTYTVTDQYGLSTNGTALLQIAAANDAPVTQSETAITPEDTAMVFTQAELLANDTDVDVATDGQVLRISAVSGATNGAVTMLANGDIRFTPNLNYHGPAQFTYWVNDGLAANGAGAQTPATVKLTISAVNDAPVAESETMVATEDTPFYIEASTLLANDSDVDAITDGQVLSLSAVSAIAGQTHGAVSLITQLDGTQRVQFIPDLNYHGVAKFNYTVSDGHGGFATATATVNLAAVNDAPVTQGEVVSTLEDTAIVFTQAELLANDSDVDVATDGQVLRISAVSGATNGTVTMLANGDIRFTPNLNYHGPAEFTYTVNDGNGGTTEAIVNLTITSVNDAPVVEGETMAATEDTPFYIEASTLLANDSDVDAITDGQVLSLSAVSAIAGQTHGAVSLITQLDGTQRVHFIPDLNYHGVAKFNYTVSDGHGGFATATATVNLAAVNDAPVTQGEDATTLEDTAIVFTQAELLANDSDVDVATDGQVLRISAVSGATNGTVTMLANGDIRFVPTSNYHGPAEFTYTVNDGSVTEGAGAATNAIVKFTITAVNDVPVAVGDVFTSAEDTTTVFKPQDLLGNDTDNDVATDNDVLTITRVFAPQHCTVTLNADGTISLTPEVNYHGNVRFSYEITDTQGATSVAFVVAGVNAVNDAPVAYADTFSSLEDNIVTLNQADLLGNDSDNDMATDGDALRVATVSNATNGEVRLLPDGKIEFVPTKNFHGTATFDYVVSDSFGATSLSTVTLQVGAVNDLPVVVNEADAATEDIVYATTANTLLANDSDVDTATDGQVLTITQVQNAQHGVVAMDVNGRISFTPDANFHGIASFEYVVSDGTGAGAGGLRTGTVTLTVQAINDAPVTQGETATTLEDTPIVFTQAELLANDSDVDGATDGQVLRISTVSGATNGTVTMLANGDIRFLPTSNFHGPAQFTYTVSDGNGGTTDAIVNLTITAVNDAPVVEGETMAATEDTPFFIEASTLLANDSDVDTLTDGQVLSLSAVSEIAGQTHGMVSLITQADGTQQVQFTPDLNYHGVAKFNYTVSDGNGGFVTATATINIAAVNDAPVTQGESYSSDEDIGLIFKQAQLLANDSDADVATDDQVLRISAVSGATNGTVTMLANGDIRFTPNSDYHGPAQFTYTVSDGNGGNTDAIVNLTITAVNDAPVVEGETIAAAEDTPFFIEASTLLANDSDVDTLTDGQVLSLSAVSEIAGQTRGMVSLITQPDGTQRVQFIPDLNYHGVAKFNYTVSDGHGGFTTSIATVNLKAVNDAPVTQGESWQSNEDEALLFLATQLLSNDTDVDTATENQKLSISRVTCDAAKGLAWVDAQGNLRFVPTSEYHGVVDLTYWVSDGAAADGAGAETPATLSLTIAALNDIPVVQGEVTNTTEDTTLSIEVATLLINDTDVDIATDSQVLSISALSNAAHCSVSLVTHTDGSQRITFVPDANFHGAASFNYTVTDSHGGTAIATAVVNLSSINDAPVTTGETATGDEDFTLVFTSQDLLANDSDMDVATDSQVLSISRVGNATHGTVVLDAQGQVHFTPDVNYYGPAQFTYWVSDGLAVNGAGAEVPATVSLTILAVNDLPVVIGETVNTNEDTTLLFNPATLLANDTDVDVVTDSQTLRIASVSNATHGTVAFVTQPDGSQQIAFTPERNHVGFASYQYTVSDGVGGTATTTVVVNLAAVNDAPDVEADVLSTIEDTPLTVTQAALLANDSDVDNPYTDLRIVGVSNATHGSVSLNSDGSISFNPDLDYFGAATFNYTVGDGVSGFSVGTATLNIAPVNDAPVTVGESLTLNEDEIVTFSVASLLANDTDVDNTHTDLSIQSVGNATHGSVSLVTTNGSTSVLFRPELNFNGTASFTYTVSDGVGGTSTTSMSLDFTPVNDMPVVNNELLIGKRNVSYSLSAAALLTNDTDVETPNGLTVASVGNAHHGSVSLINGNVVFVPEAGYSGRGSFDYVVQDANGGQSTGSTQIDFSRVNVNPTAVDDSFSGFEDVSFSITQAQLLVNDSDSDNANTSLRVANLGSATHGTVGFDEQGNVVFTPDANFYGQARFTYQVSDGDGGSTWATAYVNIASVNDAPIIEDVWYGRPIYGYQGLSGVDDEGHSFMRYDRVTSAATAASVIGSGAQLYLQQIKQVEGNEGVIYDYVSYHAYSPTYYRNGDMRPVAFDNMDATYSWEDQYNSGFDLVNDVYRQNGGVVAYDPDGDSHAVTFSIGSTPQHGHAWVNQYTNATAPVQLDHTAASSYGVASKGAWQYYSSKGDIYSGNDAFTVRVTDAGGASTDALINSTHTSWPSGGGGDAGCLAVVIDLDVDDDSVELISAEDSQFFQDVNADGWRERIGWASSDDGFLALDRNGDGLIPSDDAERVKFGIWRDANSNGVHETGEFRSLDDSGIASIELTSDAKLRVDQGNVVFGETQVHLTSGKSWVASDVMFAGQGVAYPSQVQDALLAQQAELMRKTLLFNHVCVTGVSGQGEPLGFADTRDPLLHCVIEPALDFFLDSRATG